jgi:Arc/MetJ-type ribon-helix-helix transcriptional regulator
MYCATLSDVSRSLHVRLDSSSVAALSVIRNDGLSDSEAVRTALREAAARRRARSSIVAEVRRLAADEGDQEEMRIVREQMAELAPEPTD